MRKKVLLSNLTVGKCFTTIPIDEKEVVETARGAKTATSVVAPEHAWRITDVDAEVKALNAKGEAKAFDPATKVVEIPRQGFDTLAARPAAEPKAKRS